MDIFSLFKDDIFIITLVASATWYLYLLKLTEQKRISQILEIPSSVLVLLFVFKAYPLDKLSPETLVYGDTPLINILLRLIIWGASLLLIRKWVGKLFVNLAEIFKEPTIRLLLFWSLISATWSATPIFSAWSTLIVVGFSGIATTFAKKYSWEDFYNLLRWVLFVCGVISIVGTIIGNPLPGGLGSIGYLNFYGDTSNKPLANFLALNTGLWVLNLVSFPKRQLMSGFIAISSFVPIFYINSVANIFTAIILICLVLLLFSVKRFNSKHVPIIICLYLFLSVLLLVYLQSNIGEIFDAFGKSTNLTGRGTNVWPAVIKEISKQPFVGYGFASYWQPWRGLQDPSINFEMYGSITHAHNGFLELVLQLGLVGLSLFLAVLVKTFHLSLKYFFKSNSLRDSILPLLLLVYVIITCLAETPRLGVFGPHHIWLFLVFILANLNAESRKISGKII